MSGTPSRNHVLFILAVFFGLLFSGHTASSQAGDWAGAVRMEDGVEIVSNPRTPIEDPFTIALRELWRVGGDSQADEEFFGIINQVVTDADGNVYLLDQQLNEVRVFSPDGDYLHTIGREGEGPGEFRAAADMFFLPNGNLGVLQLAPGRIVAFTLAGEPADDYPTPRTEGGETPRLFNGQRWGDGLALIIGHNEQRDGALYVYRSLIKVDSDGVELERLLTSERVLSFVDFLFDETIWRTFDDRWKVGPSGDLYAVDGYLDYEIIVWDRQGNRKRVITRDYDHWDRTKEEKQEMYDIFDALLQNQLPEYSINISDYDSDVVDVHPRKDGSLWVLTSRGAWERPEGSLGVFDVFDSDGRFLRKMTLMGEGHPLEDGYFFVGDRLFVVTDLLEARISSRGGRKGDGEAGEEPEPVSVICYEISSSDAIAQVDTAR